MLVPYDLSEPGGVKHHALELARVLRGKGDQVTVIGPGPRRYRSEEDTVAFPGIASVVSNGSDNRLGIFIAPWRVWSFFRRNAFDVIHVHEPLLPSLSFWAIWSTPGTPHVATFHAYGEQQSKALAVAARAFAKLQFPFIDRAVAVSTAAVRSARDVWHRPLPIVPNGVSTSLFSPIPAVRSPDSPLRLLFVGRVSDQRKGFRYLLDAYRRLRSGGARVTLDVVGDTSGPVPPDEPGLTYHGPLPLNGLVDRYRGCDVFVAPSTGQESFGIVLLEAMACGKPIICSDIDGYRTTVSRRGAILVPPRDSVALSDAITRLSTAPAAGVAMGEYNRARALEMDWSNVASRVRNEYLFAIQQRRRVAPVQLAPASFPLAIAPAGPPKAIKRQDDASVAGDLSGDLIQQTGSN